MGHRPIPGARSNIRWLLDLVARHTRWIMSFLGTVQDWVLSCDDLENEPFMPNMSHWYMAQLLLNYTW